MSYRVAWGYLRELESAAGFALLERSGTGPASGMRLTDDGRAFLDAFEAFRKRLDDDAARAFDEEFANLVQPAGRRARKADPPRRKR